MPRVVDANGVIYALEGSDLTKALVAGTVKLAETVAVETDSGRSSLGPDMTSAQSRLVGATGLVNPDEARDTREEAWREEYYGSQNVKAGLEGFASGLTLGASDVALDALGADTANRAAYNPNVRLGTELTGMLAAAVATGGTGAGAGASRLGMLLAKTPAGAVTKAATGLGAKIGGVKGLAAGAAIEGAAYSAGQTASQLLITDEPLSAEAVFAEIGKNAAFGAGAGAVGGAVVGGLGKGWTKLKAARASAPVVNLATDEGAAAARSMADAVSELDSVADDLMGPTAVSDDIVPAPVAASAVDNVADDVISVPAPVTAAPEVVAPAAPAADPIAALRTTGDELYAKVRGITPETVKQAAQAAPAAGSSIAQRMDEAFGRIDAASGGNNYVFIGDLRKALPDVPKDVFDAELTALRKQKHFTADPLQNQSKTSAERYGADWEDQMLVEGPQRLGLIARRGDPLGEPAAPGFDVEAVKTAKKHTMRLKNTRAALDKAIASGDESAIKAASAKYRATVEDVAGKFEFNIAGRLDGPQPEVTALDDSALERFPQRATPRDYTEGEIAARLQDADTIDPHSWVSNPNSPARSGAIAADLTDEQAAAMYAYQHGPTKVINGQLRGTTGDKLDPTEFREFFAKANLGPPKDISDASIRRHLDEAIESSVVPEDTYVYRGTDYFPINGSSVEPHNISIGDVLDPDRGYMSTSVSRDSSFSFANDLGGMSSVLRIKVPAGAQGRFVRLPVRAGKYTPMPNHYNGEFEVLLPRNVQLRITNVREIGGDKSGPLYRQLDAEIVNPKMGRGVVLPDRQLPLQFAAGGPERSAQMSLSLPGEAAQHSRVAKPTAGATDVATPSAGQVELPFPGTRGAQQEFDFAQPMPVAAATPPTALLAARKAAYDALGVTEGKITQQHIARLMSSPAGEITPKIQALSDYADALKLAADNAGNATAAQRLDDAAKAMSEATTGAMGGVSFSAADKALLATAVGAEGLDMVGVDNPVGELATAALAAKYVKRGFGTKLARRALGIMGGRASSHVLAQGGSAGLAAFSLGRGVATHLFDAAVGQRAIAGVTHNAIDRVGAAFGKLGRAVGKAKPHITGPALIRSARFGYGPDAEKPTPPGLHAAFKDRQAELAAFAANPMAGQQAIHDELAEVRKVQPYVADELEMLAVKTNMYLYDQMPKDPGTMNRLGESTWRPSEYEIRSWGECCKGALAPVETFEDALGGRITPKAAHAVRYLYPNLYGRMQQNLAERAPELRKTLTLQERTRLSILFDTPLDSTMRPDFRGFIAEQHAMRNERDAQAAQTNKPNGATANPAPLTGAQILIA